MTNGEIARGVRHHEDVTTHRGHVYQKLGITGREQLEHALNRQRELKPRSDEGHTVRCLQTFRRSGVIVRRAGRRGAVGG